MRSDPAGDLHARARIRNAAIELFGREGFGAGLRAVAADAGVSPALVLHHFGSKDGLRKACDDYTRDLIRFSRLESVGPGGVEHMLAQLAQVEQYAPVATYAVASLVDGGELARELLDQLTEDAVDYLRAGVAAGTIRPSHDDESRARFLAHAGLGILIIQHQLARASGEPIDTAQFFRTVADITSGPALEIYTHGLFTDSRYLDAYRAYEAGEAAAPDAGGDQPPATDHLGDRT